MRTINAAGFWLVNDYFPEILAVDRRIFPSLEAIGRELGRVKVSVVPIPRNCTDGFLGAYWQRPEAYLNPAVRNAISTFGKLGSVQEGLSRLREDLPIAAQQALAAGGARRDHETPRLKRDVDRMRE